MELFFTIACILLAANLFKGRGAEKADGKSKTSKRGFIPTWLLVLLALVLFGFSLRGNPTQQLEKLVKMMKQGMVGGEDTDAFDKLYKDVGSNDQHNAYDADVANSFYNLATEFYEYGWGDSFHFGFRRNNEPHSKAIANSQHFVAQKLNVRNMDRVLDMGCGIGGPLRGVVRATGANVTGLTINAHQVRRAQEITRGLTPWMQERCHFVRQDYLNIKGMELEAYDAAFYMESSLHCENRTQTFSEVYKLLKPGGRLVAMEYNLLPGWKPDDPEHQELMKKHLWGNGAAKTPSIEEDLAMVRAAGFEIAEHFDFMEYGKNLYGEDSWEWWADLQFNWRFHLLPAHPWIRTPLPKILNALAYIGLVPEGVPKAAELMNLGGDGLSGLGKVGAITPQYFVLGVKPKA
jgi:sterol 24-C-methyltransferase